MDYPPVGDLEDLRDISVGQVDLFQSAAIDDHGDVFRRTHAVGLESHARQIRHLLQDPRFQVDPQKLVPAVDLGAQDEAGAGVVGGGGEVRVRPLLAHGEQPDDSSAGIPVFVFRDFQLFFQWLHTRFS